MCIWLFNVYVLWRHSLYILNLLMGALYNKQLIKYNILSKQMLFSRLFALASFVKHFRPSTYKQIILIFYLLGFFCTIFLQLQWIYYFLFPTSSHIFPILPHVSSYLDSFCSTPPAQTQFTQHKHTHTHQSFLTTNKVPSSSLILKQKKNNKNS